MYERYSSLEKHLSFGKCRMMPKKENLLDKAKRTYHALLKEDTSTAKALEAGTLEVTDGVILSEGWALKTTKNPHDSMKLKRSTWRINLTLGRKKVTTKTLREWQEICVLQRKQMGLGCSQPMSFCPHNRYSHSFQEWHLSCVTLQPGLEKYLNSTLPVGQVTPKFCLPGALPRLPKFSNSLIIHEPKN